jgi:quinol monooxygenase YgiN
MIHVVAVITAIPGQRDALIAAYKENVPNVLAEAGCIEYAGVVDVEGFGRAATPMGPDAFVVIEKWESADALKAHAVAPHKATFGAKIEAITESRAIHILAEV